MITWNNLFFQCPSSFMGELIVSIHDYAIIFIVSTLILVLLSMGYLYLIRSFNFRFFENHQLETVWTALPFIILFFIVFPSLSSLYIIDACSFCGLTFTAIGHQWYWRYNFKDEFFLIFDSYMEPRAVRNIRLLDVDNRVCLPTYTPVRVLISSADVIHSWTVPSLGVKIDAVPGRINQFCFLTKRSGVFFGQCSEICGANHSFIPIVLESVRFKNFIQIF